MPRSSSMVLESIEIPSATAPHWRRIASVKVVLPWSTWAIIAMFLISIEKINPPSGGGPKAVLLTLLLKSPKRNPASIYFWWKYFRVVFMRIGEAINATEAEIEARQFNYLIGISLGNKYFN